MTGLLIRGISNEAASVLDPFSTLVDYQPLAALAFSNYLHHSVFVNFDLALESWTDMGVSSAARPASDGDGSCSHDPLARKIRVQNSSPQAVGSP